VPHVLDAAPASHPEEPAPVPGFPDGGGVGPTGVPHALSFGTQTLTWSPA
jgi:hypothetical protein